MSRTKNPAAVAAACLLIAQLAALPLSHAQTAGWTGADIGAVAAAGSHSISGNAFTVRASGVDIWNRADEFRFVYRTLTGDGEITAQVSSVTNTNEWTKAGVMLRESLTADARFALMCVTPGKGAAFHYRTSTGGSAAPLNSGDLTTKAPYWVRGQARRHDRARLPVARRHELDVAQQCHVEQSCEYGLYRPCADQSSRRHAGDRGL